MHKEKTEDLVWGEHKRQESSLYILETYGNLYTSTITWRSKPRLWAPASRSKGNKYLTLLKLIRNHEEVTYTQNSRRGSWDTKNHWASKATSNPYLFFWGLPALSPIRLAVNNQHPNSFSQAWGAAKICSGILDWTRKLPEFERLERWSSTSEARSGFDRLNLPL